MRNERGRGHEGLAGGLGGWPRGPGGGPGGEGWYRDQCDGVPKQHGNYRAADRCREEEEEREEKKEEVAGDPERSP